MKKVVNINLGGFPITIDEDAFARLEQYLAAVDRSFSHLEGHDEILHDIEIRIAELLQEQLKGRAIVSMSDVHAVIGIMGKPEDFRDDTSAGPEPGDGQRTKQSDAPPFEEAPFGFRPGKKLFRDPEDKIIGGVCSGLAAYFGIPDPVWIRLAFALLLFTGFGILTYLVLLVIVPKAVTSADRLAMRGEPVNISTIANAVEKQFEEISEKLNEIGEDLRRKKK